MGKEVTLESLNTKLDTIIEVLDQIEQNQDDLADGQERLEEAVANVSLPGSNYTVDEV